MMDISHNIAKEKIWTRIDIKFGKVQRDASLKENQYVYETVTVMTMMFKSS
jgi:hypothetical protein